MNTNLPDEDIENPSSFPVSVILERQPVLGHRWIKERWRGVGVVPGQRNNEGHRRVSIRKDEHGEQFMWTGFTMNLFVDDGVSYYSNLMGENPCVFIVCHRGEDGDEADLNPFIATVSYSEAASYMETDEEVFSVEMPREIYLWLERFVLENYRPEESKKRQRKKWFKKGQDGA